MLLTKDHSRRHQQGCWLLLNSWALKIPPSGRMIAGEQTPASKGQVGCTLFSTKLLYLPITALSWKCNDDESLCRCHGKIYRLLCTIFKLRNKNKGCLRSFLSTLQPTSVAKPGHDAGNQFNTISFLFGKALNPSV